MWSSEGCEQFRFLQFPCFYVVELAKRQWSGFCQTHLWGKSKCEQAQRRPLLSLRGAEEKEVVKDSSQPQTAVSWTLGSGVQLVGQTGVLHQECAPVFYDCLWCKTRHKWGASGTFWGCPDEVDHALTARCREMRWRSDYARLERRQEQSWMSYDALVGSLVSGLWKQPFNLQPLIFYLLFRVHKRSEI